MDETNKTRRSLEQSPTTTWRASKKPSTWEPIRTPSKDTITLPCPAPSIDDSQDRRPFAGPWGGPERSQRERGNPAASLPPILPRSVFSIDSGRGRSERPRPRGITPLHRAVADKRFLSSAQRLLENGADPNVRTNVRGTTPLHWANSDAATTRLLTWKSYPKADPNAPDRQGQTPLHYAVSNPDSDRMERYNQVQSLLNGGADPNIRTHRQETPLHRATLSLRESLAEVSMLVQSGADVRSRDDVGNTPLHYAAGHASVDRCSVVQRLLEKGARPNEQNHAGQTPLHLAAGREGEGQAEAITKLLTNGADPNIADAKGQTPIDVASPTAQEIFARRYNSPEQKERRAMNDRAANKPPTSRTRPMNTTRSLPIRSSSRFAKATRRGRNRGSPARNTCPRIYPPARSTGAAIPCT